MNKKYYDTEETPFQLTQTLRAGYAGNREREAEACPFAEQAIAYALEELTPDLQETMAAHLENCSTCMDLSG